MRRLEISGHELLRELAGLLQELEAPAPPYREIGDWRADVAAGPPAVDRTRPAAFRFAIMDWQQPAWMPGDATIASVNYFPPGGAGLGWHTDSSRPGWRVYIGRPLDHRPGVLFVQGANYHDAPGIANAFLVPDRVGESWHAVGADGPRFSIGIRIDVGSATARALGLSC